MVAGLIWRKHVKAGMIQINFYSNSNVAIFLIHDKLKNQNAQDIHNDCFYQIIHPLHTQCKGKQKFFIVFTQWSVHL